MKPEVSSIKSEIKGFIFGLDGVLIDTAELRYQAWQKLANEEVIPFNREANEALPSISRRDSLIKIIGEFNYLTPALSLQREVSYRGGAGSCFGGADIGSIPPLPTSN